MLQTPWLGPVRRRGRGIPIEDVERLRRRARRQNPGGSRDRPIRRSASTASTATSDPRMTRRPRGRLAPHARLVPGPPGLTCGRRRDGGSAPARGYRLPAMLLDSVNSPADLRRLSYPELDELAVEIREFIVEAVARARRPPRLQPRRRRADPRPAPRVRLARATSSCGTPATRPTSTRSSPGAATSSTTLRQAGGLSGYPSRAESEHDWVENSHASTILSYAHGLADAPSERRTATPTGGSSP